MRSMKVAILTLGVFVSFTASHAFAACKNDTTEKVSAGAGIGAIAGGLAGGAAIKITIVKGGLAVVLSCGPAMPVCAGALVGGAAVGATAGWAFSDRDCAGAIVTDGKELFFNWNFDSTQSAIKNTVEDCEDATRGKCKIVETFRHCAAVEQSSNRGALFVGLGKTGADAWSKAQKACRAAGGYCWVLVAPQCNRG